MGNGIKWIFRLLWLAAPGALTLAVGPLNLAAQEPPAPEVVRLGVEGRKAYDAGDHRTAARLFDDAYARFPLPTFALWSARAHDRLGRRADAAIRYRRAADAPADLGVEAKQVQAQAQAQAELSAMLPLIPTLTVRVMAPAGTGISIQLDGALLPLQRERHPVNPGQHRIKVSGPEESRTLVVHLADAEHKVLSVDLRTPDEGYLRPIGIGALALGGAGLLTAGVLTLIATQTCEGIGLTTASCEDAQAQKTHSALRTTAIATWYAGLASAAAGVLTLLVFTPTAEHSTSVELSATGTSLRMTF